MKGQSEIISVVLIILISIALISAAYTWGLPLIQKRQDTAKIERISSYFSQSFSSSLPSLIEFVARNGGEATFSLEADGLWQLYPDGSSTPYNNSVSFTFFSKVSNVAANKGWISLTPGASCPPAPGVLGEESASVVCERADSLFNGFNITYLVFFRSLSQAGSNNVYRISLDRPATGSLTSTGKALRIINAGTDERTEGDKKLIITKINILLS